MPPALLSLSDWLSTLLLIVEVIAFNLVPGYMYVKKDLLCIQEQLQQSRQVKVLNPIMAIILRRNSATVYMYVESDSQDDAKIKV